MACGILVPRPGIEPLPPAMEAQTLNHWTTREFPVFDFKSDHFIQSKIVQMIFEVISGA